MRAGLADIASHTMLDPGIPRIPDKWIKESADDNLRLMYARY